MGRSKATMVRPGILRDKTMDIYMIHPIPNVDKQNYFLCRFILLVKKLNIASLKPIK